MRRYCFIFYMPGASNLTLARTDFWAWVLVSTDFTGDAQGHLWGARGDVGRQLHTPLGTQASSIRERRLTP